jgi:AcrR family transcriptional regulator
MQGRARLASLPVDTKEQILAAALSVYGRYGFRGATTRRIAHAAGVNEVTVFRHFGSKDALLAEAIRHSGGKQAAQALPAEPRDPVRELTGWAQGQLEHLRSRRAVVRTCLSEVEERPELGDCAFLGPRVAFTELSAYLRALQLRGLVKREFDVEAVGAMLVGSLFADAISRDMAPDIFPPSARAARSYVALLAVALGLEPEDARGATVRAPAPPTVPDATGA